MQNLRAVYDKVGENKVSRVVYEDGRKTTNSFYHQMDKEGPVTMEDAAGFFANVFGGERFVDYVRFPLYYIFPVDIKAHLDW